MVQFVAGSPSARDVVDEIVVFLAVATVDLRIVRRQGGDLDRSRQPPAATAATVVVAAARAGAAAATVDVGGSGSSGRIVAHSTSDTTMPIASSRHTTTNDGANRVCMSRAGRPCSSRTGGRGSLRRLLGELRARRSRWRRLPGDRPGGERPSPRPGRWPGRRVGRCRRSGGWPGRRCRAVSMWSSVEAGSPARRNSSARRSAPLAGRRLGLRASSRWIRSTRPRESVGRKRARSVGITLQAGECGVGIGLADERHTAGEALVEDESE